MRGRQNDNDVAFHEVSETGAAKPITVPPVL